MGMMAQIELVSGADHAVIALEGAELRQWNVRGRDLIWQPDGFFWDRTAPVLFPVCGWTRDGVRVDGQHYPLGLHGFVHSRLFSCEREGPDAARFMLRDDAASHALYPFSFCVSMHVRLGDGRLDMALEVQNCGDRPMPYACGVHPAFAWAPQAQNGRFVFLGPKGRDVAPFVPVIAKGGLFSTRQRPIDLHDGVLALRPYMWQQEALCFLNVPTDRFMLQSDMGQLHIATQNFSPLRAVVAATSAVSMCGKLDRFW